MFSQKGETDERYALSLFFFFFSGFVRVISGSVDPGYCCVTCVFSQEAQKGSQVQTKNSRSSIEGEGVALRTFTSAETSGCHIICNEKTGDLW